MRKEKKIVVFVLLVSIVAILLVVYRYEKRLLDMEREHSDGIKLVGGKKIKKQYTAQEIIDLIKKHPNYLGDSITIFESGEISSSNGQFNGTIAAVVSSTDNMNAVKSEAKNNKLPLQYNIYLLAATYYKQQYPNEFKKSAE